jgi:RNA polymerase sigma-70 factor (ECF subfamily)
MVGDRETAEELAQETFVRAYRSLGSLREENRLSTWLFGIAKNVARASLRPTVQDRREVALSEAASVEATQLTAFETLQNKELAALLQRALRSLDEDRRRVFTLKVFHQFSYEEIAEITGMSIPKLKTDLFRARHALRRQIATTEQLN